MKRDAVKDLIYGGLAEITKNAHYYYTSSVGTNYGHLTEQGREVVLQYLEEMIRILRTTEQEDLDRRAKSMVIDGLTKTS